MRVNPANNAIPYATERHERKRRKRSVTPGSRGSFAARGSLRVFDQFRHPNAELFIDRDDFTPSYEPIVNKQVDRATSEAIEFDDGTRSKLENVFDQHFARAKLSGYFERNAHEQVEIFAVFRSCHHDRTPVAFIACISKE